MKQLCPTIWNTNNKEQCQEYEDTIFYSIWPHRENMTAFKCCSSANTSPELNSSATNNQNKNSNTSKNVLHPFLHKYNFTLKSFTSSHFTILRRNQLQIFELYFHRKMRLITLGVGVAGLVRVRRSLVVFSNKEMANTA